MINLKIVIGFMVSGLCFLVLGYLNLALILLTIGVVLACAIIGDRRP
jgi:hypothetical protein